MKPKIHLLGIVNLTDDSYYAASRVRDTDTLLGRVGTMLAEGADWIDIGACSTRPGSQPVGAEEEWRRLEPALQAIRGAFPEARISIDTYWASVVERVYDLIGPFMVNDISAGAYDAAMLPLAGRLGLPYIAMHLRGTPETMQTLTDYPKGVTAEVLRYFKAFAKRAAKAAITDWILDPGFGFAKTVEQNWTLLEELDRLQALQQPILVGVSRKSMIYKRFGITPEEALPATQVAHLLALQHGATWLRVHDVAEARRTIAIFDRDGRSGRP
jgi:dihydropteroate synthase